MRNLSVAHRGVLEVESLEYPELPLAAVSFDTVGDSIRCVFGPSSDIQALEVQRILKSGESSTVAAWDLPDACSVRDVRYFADGEYCILVLSNGDIVRVTEPSGLEENAVVEIVGSVEAAVGAAQWSPDETILAVATDSSLVLLSRTFELIAETERSAGDLKISKHVSVGWGKKDTQFQGKGAKALRDPTVPEKVDDGRLSDMDNTGSISISWRGDGEFVVINSTDELYDGFVRRTVRVYSREGKLDSVSEPVDTLEDQVSWRPSGNLIASVQRVSSQQAFKDKGPDLVFFERNGLRRGQFSLRLADSDKVHAVAWNPDSDVLAVHVDDRIQLWTTKNYHWYLKQQVIPRSIKAKPLWMKWHPEKPLTLLLCYSENLSQYKLETHTFLWSLYSGPAFAPADLGTTVVTDGSIVKATPLKVSNVPPPMAFREFDVDNGEVPVHVAVHSTNDLFAVLTATRVCIAQWELANGTGAKKPNIVKEIPLNFVVPDDTVPKQVAYVDNLIAVVVDEVVGSCIVILELDQDFEYSVAEVHNIPVDILLIKPRSDFAAFVYETIDGSVFSLEPPQAKLVDQLASLPRRCNQFDVWQPPTYEEPPVVFGLTENGKLYANSRLLANAVTSMTITENYLLFTTAQHFLKFCHLVPNVDSLVIAQDDVENDERTRAIERGSLIVAAMPSKTAVVLQAPRGNLETVHPRIMALSEVRNSIQQVRYDWAFMACRMHRVDMNLLHDYAPTQFFDKLDVFIKQLNTPENIDLFLSGLKEEDVSQTMYRATHEAEAAQPDQTAAEAPQGSKVNRICDGILEVLSTPAFRDHYMQSILTAHACKNPPDLLSALQMVSDTRKDDAQLAEASVQHLCYLQDVELLYRSALELYDLDVALLVAQQSQKDPKEYLPFLQDLQEREESRRRFLIDDYLKFYVRALGHLAEMGDEAWDELVEYVREHLLYEAALKTFRHNADKHAKILAEFADYLVKVSEFSEAGLAYESLKDYANALEAYQRAGEWRSALAIARRTESGERLKQIATAMAELMTERHQYTDAATIYLEYLEDLTEAANMYVKGNYFDEALRVIAQHDRPELVESVVEPGLRESFGIVLELLVDCKAQVKSQVNRLRELRKAKAEDPLAFFGAPEDSEAPDNVSLAPSELSTAPSFLTRYTGKTGETAKTGASRRTAKNRRREERKRARGKKGSVYEEEYLINSQGRLIERLEQTIPEATRLVNGLIQQNMLELAHQIQKNFVEVLDDVREVVVEVFTLSPADLTRYDDEGNAYQLPPKPVPQVPVFPRKRILDY